MLKATLQKVRFVSLTKYFLIMRKVFFYVAGLAILAACKNSTIQAEEKESGQEEISNSTEDAKTSAISFYGDTINEDGALAIADLSTMMEGHDSLAVKLTGVVNSSCQKKGCWMKMDMGDGQEMHVSFKDYSFFVPTNLNGENAIVDGYVTIDTIDVPFLKHLAEDAGKSEEEIAQITEPEITVSYVANGVIIKS